MTKNLIKRDSKKDGRNETNRKSRLFFCLLLARLWVPCEDMEQPTGSKVGKEYVKAVYCHPTYLTYMQSTS